LALVMVGVVGVVLATGTVLDAWWAAQEWSGSAEAESLARQLAEPKPVWIAQATLEPSAARIEPIPTAVVPAVVEQAVERPQGTAALDMLSLESADFRFLEPPEPGARARIAVRVQNSDTLPSDRILLGVGADWFDAYRIIGSVPAVAEDRTDEAGLRTFSFPPLPPGESASYELHVAPIGEDTRPPTVQVRLGHGDLVAEALTVTYAPPPRPGPVMSLEIPSLKLKTGVIQTAWEAPPFIVGQIKDSAHITVGNTILVGHVSGRAGNVFGKLDELKPGDKVTAISRGLPYEFVVSQIILSTNTDATPMLPSEDGKLTLMTCAGPFNPITRDYPERLWVIAEAPEKAVQTIARVSATATVAVAATATAFALIPTPTPYAGEPSAAGGLGNTREDVGDALGAPLGETPGNMVVFRESGREYRVLFTPDPARAAMLVILPPAGQRMSLDAAVSESRKFFPNDTLARSAAPEGNAEFVVERFESPTLELALGTAEFSIIYTRDRQGFITRIVFGLGDDFPMLLQQASQ